MILTDKYKVAIFDCDGVILDSNKVKSNAFSTALEDEDPSLVKQFINYHKANGGVSRYVKFEYFYREIKEQKNYKYQVDVALDKYANICKRELVSCNEISGIKTLLDMLKQWKIPCYVISGGAQEEVIEVLEVKGLSKYFKKILGSPLAKENHLNDLFLSDDVILPGIYFGDARSDYIAAINFSLDFVFVSGFSDWVEGIKVCENNNITNIFDFSDVIYS